MTLPIQKISVVIPVYNEAGNIQTLYQELKSVLQKQPYRHEIIFVDDGSRDDSFKILEAIHQHDHCVQVIALLGNHGQTAALSAGFQNASGSVVVAMDGDGQHDPRYIPAFVAAIAEGYDVASGWKQKDPGASRMKFILSQIAHKMIAKISGAKMKYFGATLKAYRSNVIKNLDLSGDLHRFAGALIYYKGIKIKEIPIQIRPRRRGKSSYKLTKIAKVALDLILIKFLVKYSKAPFRIFGLLGVILIILGCLGLIGVFIAKYAFGESTASNASVLIISAIFSIVGVQFLFFGLVAELISRLYYSAGQRKTYIIREHLKSQN